MKPELGIAAEGRTRDTLDQSILFVGCGKDEEALRTGIEATGTLARMDALAAEVVARLRALQDVHGDAFKPADLLVELAASSGRLTPPAH